MAPATPDSATVERARARARALAVAFAVFMATVASSRAEPADMRIRTVMATLGTNVARPTLLACEHALVARDFDGVLAALDGSFGGAAGPEAAAMEDVARVLQLAAGVAAEDASRRHDTWALRLYEVGVVTRAHRRVAPLNLCSHGNAPR